MIKKLVTPQAIVLIHLVQIPVPVEFNCFKLGSLSK